MKIVYWPVLLMLLLSGMACQQPDFIDTNGVGHQIDQNKWMYVNYWATWCGPCIKEIPELNELARSHATQLVIYGVNFDEPGSEEMGQHIRKMKIEFPVFQADPYRQFGYERPQVLPTTLVFAPGGQLVKTLVGPQTEASLLAVIEEFSTGSMH